MWPPGAGGRMGALATLAITLAMANLVGGRSKEYGLTTYGEPCIDSCKQRGFPFTWCHKAKSRNGTFIDRDYCSSEYGVTRYSEQCLDNCERRGGKPFHWCHTHPTRRGDWDYCSPYPRDQCQWSSWGSWGRCSAPCGSPGSRTRRRRIEGASGRVGTCSGETEVAFQACRDTTCSGSSASGPMSSECGWGTWGTWSPCSRTCGGGGLRRRYRVLTKHSPKHHCPGEAEEMAECGGPACPTTTPPSTSTHRVTTPLNLEGERVKLGTFENTLHDVSGTVSTLGEDRLLLEDFTYDGSGPDAFFYIGTEGSPGPRATVLTHPFEGRFYDYRDPRVPILRPHPSPSRLVLALPPGLPASSVRWISVWCRQFNVDFGHVIRESPTTQTTIGSDGPSSRGSPVPTAPASPPVSTGPVSSSTSRKQGSEVTEVRLNEIQGSHEGGRGVVRPSPDPSVITVDLPDFHSIPPETPRAIGGSRGKTALNLNSFATSSSKPKKPFSISASSKGPKPSSGKVTEVKAAAAPGAEDVDFTVIRVQSSVSQETPDGANEDGEESEEEQEEPTTTVAPVRPTVTVDGFKVDKIIEIPLDNIDGVSRFTSQGTSRGTARTTTSTTSPDTTTTAEPSSTSSEPATTKKVKPELTRQDLRDLTKNSIERTSTPATTPRRLRPSLFHPASNRPNRLDILARTTPATRTRLNLFSRPTPAHSSRITPPSSSSRKPAAFDDSSRTTPLTSSKRPSPLDALSKTTPASSSKRPSALDALAKNTSASSSKRPTGLDALSRTTPTTSSRTPTQSRNTPASLLDRALEEEIHNFFDTSTPKPRRFTVVPRLTTLATTNNQEDGTNQRGDSSAPNNEGVSFGPKVVSDPPVRGVSPPRPTIGSLFGGRGRGRNPGSGRSPIRPFSFRPRNGVTTAATTAGSSPQDRGSEVGLGINLGVPTISPGLPPARTSPGPGREAPAPDTTRPSGGPEAGISPTPRHSPITESNAANEDDATTEQPATESQATQATRATRRPLFGRRPGFLPRRPGLARSTTVSSILSTPKVRTGIFKNSIRNKIFARRRSTTIRPIELETVVPSLEEDEQDEDVEDNEIAEVAEADRTSGDRKLSGFGTKANQVVNDESDRDEKPFRRPFGNHRNKFKFKHKFRPIRPPFLPRRTTTALTTTTEPIPQTTGARETQGPRAPEGPSSVRPFPFVPTRQTTEPAPQTTQGARSRPAFSRFTTPSAGVTVTTPFPPTSPRMSDDERFEIFTGFMKQTEIMTTISGKEITTVAPKDVAEPEEEETTSQSFPTVRVAETPRSSVATSSKNRVVLIEEEGLDGVRPKVGSHDDGRTKWKGSRVTSRPVRPRPTDPTVTIRFDDIEGDYGDYPEVSRSSPKPRPVAPSTPRQKVDSVTSSNLADDYNPCDIRGTCGPNAKCEPVGDEPTCSCPSGFSGIPRNGRPDPQHGCVRTPQSCSAANGTSCASDHTCVRDVCLQGCRGDTECALGERCISGQEDGHNQKVCIKICFYDAHCLAGEYCEENVCRPGCRSDSNCPFGQICADGPLGSTRECEEGCNFNNDCPIEQECRGGSCADPCTSFTECGTNAECYTVNHLPTCRCPEGYKELNSPYDACVVASADLTLLECLEDSDCGRGTCHDGICKSP